MCIPSPLRRMYSNAHVTDGIDVTCICSTSINASHFPTFRITFMPGLCDRKIEPFPILHCRDLSLHFLLLIILITVQVCYLSVKIILWLTLSLPASSQPALSHLQYLGSTIHSLLTYFAKLCIMSLWLTGQRVHHFFNPDTNLWRFQDSISRSSDDRVYTFLF